MTNSIDLHYICAAIGNLAGVPIRIFEGEEQTFFCFSSRLLHDPMILYKEALWQIDSSVGYLATESFSYYGFVKFGEIRIVIGPTRQIPSTDQELRELAFRLDIAPDEIGSFMAAMKSIVNIPIEIILQILCVVNHVLSGEKLGISDISISDAEQEQLETAAEIRRADRPAVVDDKVLAPHNTMAIEEVLMNMISHGDVAALREWLSSAPAVRSGTLAKEQLRQRKNIFIVTTALSSRAAIRGGLDVEEALGLSDALIQKCELLSSPNQINNLQYHMVQEYTKKVERVRRGEKPSKLSIAVANYIQRHLSEPISVQAIADELYMSRPYLSAKFKAETGETLTDFILKEKVEEAKRLLQYTEKTIAQIGIYLGFSSHGHFSRVFKKCTRHTPHEYREKYMR